jgi:DNA-binding NarL/FixJ family response regulator
MTPTRKTTLLLAEELELVREGLAALLTATERFDIVARCGDGEQAMQLVRETRPDLALLDLNLPGYHTLELVSNIRKEGLGVMMVILATRRDRKTVLESLRMGANAYVLKSGPVRHLLDALEQVRRGGVYITPELELGKIFAVSDKAQEEDPLRGLSTREYQVFSMLVEGLRPKEIAARLSLSPKTVDTHRANLMKKLEVPDMASLVKFAVRRNLT